MATGRHASGGSAPACPPGNTKEAADLSVQVNGLFRRGYRVRLVEAM
jgi:hypothetical protein